MRWGRLSLWVFATLCLAILVSPAPADNWPRFRGPNGTGIAKDKDIPVEWSANNGILWKATIPGVGHSSPIVWANHIFLQSASEDAKERLLVCVGASDGQVLWTRAVPGSKGHTHKLNSQASSTPATDGERVYISSWDGVEVSLSAYDFKGEVVWTRNLGSFTSQHGPGGSPIVVGERVIYANDQDGKATVQAFDSKTGKPAWEAPRKAFRACYATPVVRERPDGKSEVIVASTAGIGAYDVQSGTENWHWTYGGTTRARAVASPVLGDDVVFVNLGNGEGDRHTAAVKLGDKGDVTTTNLVWQNTKGSLAYVPTLLPWGDYVYSVSDTGKPGFATCQEAKTGKVVWHERLGTGFSASPILVDGKIYAINEGGEVYVFAASPTFKLLAKKTAIGEPVTASPAVADGRLYIRGVSHLYCIGKAATK